MCRTGAGYGCWTWKLGYAAIYFLIGTGFLLTSPAPIHATQPPRPGEIEELKKKGKFKKRAKFIKELGNDKISPRLVRKFKEKKKKIKRKVLESKGLPVEEDDVSSEPDVQYSGGGFSTSDYLPPAVENKGLPTTGSPKVFTLLISFADYPNTVSSDTIDDMLWGDGDASDYPRESLSNYYARSSYGLLDLSNGHTFAWYQTAYDRSHVLDGYGYYDEYRARQVLIWEVLEHFNNEGHDFSQYDYDGDGEVDYFVVFWTGPDSGWGGFWWGYQTSWTNKTQNLDGKTLGEYSWQWESDHPSVVIHETGHALGLPDYYDYNSSMGPDGGVGDFDMMDSNRGDHNCFSKWLLGWLTPQVVSSGTHTYALGDTTTTNCVLVWPGIGLDDMFSEFFMVQNRQATGNDESFDFAPDGLAIWHVDATLGLYGSYFAYDNSDTEHKLLRLMEADGLEEIENNGDADEDDLYNETDELSPYSFPSSDQYNGYHSCVEISDIVDYSASPGVAISATFSFPCFCDGNPSPPDVLMPSAGATDVSTAPTLNWTWVSGANAYDVQVCNNINCSDIVRSVSPTANYWVVSPPLEEWNEYWWRVRTHGDCNTGDWSPPWNFTTRCESDPVDVPEHLEPVNGATNTAFDPRMAWDPVPGAFDYNVLVCTDPNCDNVIRDEMVSFNPSFNIDVAWRVDPELEPGTDYWWKVRSVNTCQYSEWSSIWSFSTHPMFPAPTLISPPYGAVHEPLLPTFQWETVPEANGYTIQICGTPQCQSIVKTYQPSENSWMCNSPLVQGTTYHWRVRAEGYATTDGGPWSQSRPFETCLNPEPPPESTLWPAAGATGASPSVTLDWDLPPGNEFPYYDVEVCTDDGYNNVVRSTHLSSHQWTVTPALSLDTTYYWRIRTTNACGISGWMSSSFTTSACPVPSETPFLTGPSFGEADVSVTPDLQWTYNLYPVFLGEEVQVCSDPLCDTVVRSTGEVSGSSWTVTPALATDTQYWWRVAYKNLCGPGLWSTIFNFRTNTCAALEAPAVADPGGFVESGESYLVSWGAVNYALEYTIQESNSTTFSKDTTNTFVVTDTSRAFSHDDTGCTGETYYYRVKALNTCNAGPWSNVVNMDINGKPAPATPVPVGISDDSTTPILDWGDVSGADRYDVKVCDDRLCLSTVTGESTKGSEWMVTPSLVEGTTYWWQVRSKNDCGDMSAWSDAWEFEPGCITPDQPLMNDPGDSAFPGQDYTVSWIAVPGATGYRVQEAESLDFFNATTFPETKKTSMTFSHYNSGCQPKIFYYRMVAVNDCGISEISRTVDMVINERSVPSVPVLISPENRMTEVSTEPMLDWADVSGVGDYDVWICLDSDCQEVIRNATVTESAWQVTPALEQGTPYWWQVLAKNVCGANMSARWRFSTVCPLPGSSILNDPGLAVASSETYALVWTAIKGANEYLVEEATDSSFTNPRLIRTVLTSMAFRHANDNCAPVTYFYRVSAINDCGQSRPSATVDMIIHFLDTDRDGIGDACDPCHLDPDNDVDRDGLCANIDNCPEIPNKDQQDTDRDDVGDVCDACPFDLDQEGDIDGSDIATFAADNRGATVKAFAVHFGKVCP